MPRRFRANEAELTPRWFESKSLIPSQRRSGFWRRCLGLFLPPAAHANRAQNECRHAEHDASSRLGQLAGGERRPGVVKGAAENTKLEVVAADDVELGLQPTEVHLAAIRAVFELEEEKARPKA